MQDNLLNLTKKLIGFRSTADRPDELLRCFDFVEHYFRGAGIETRRFIFKTKPVLFVGSTPKPEILFCGHLDVVDGDDAQFAAKFDGDKLYGRGALDMKSGCAAIIEYTKNNFPTNKKIGLVLTGDEEIGGFNGVGAMIKEGYGATKAVVIPDGGKSQFNVVTKEKGIIWLRLTAAGKSAHGSTPWHGSNAIKILTSCLFEVEKLFEPADAKTKDHWITTFNVGRIGGGNATNQVAETAVAECDIRYTEKDRPERIVDQIKKICPKEITVEVIFNEPLVNNDTENPVFKNYCEAIKKVTGKDANLIVEHGSSDARFFAGGKVPIILSEPTGDNLHGAGEWVSARSIVDFYNIIDDFVKKIS
jgi:succinyl-diaminopimelate desuccinylase